jgi:hypothetical protein
MSVAKKLDSIAIGIASITGLIFFSTSATVFKNLDGSCSSGTVRNGWAIIQALGACMLVAGIAYFVCAIFGGKCYSDSGSVKTGETYVGIMIVFSLLTCGLAISMLVEYNKLSTDEQNECDDGSKTVKKMTILILVLSIIGIIISGSILVKLNFDAKKKLDMEITP